MTPISLISQIFCIFASANFVFSQSTSTTTEGVPLIVNFDDPNCSALNGTCLTDGDCSIAFTAADRALCGSDDSVGCCQGENIIPAICKNQNGYCAVEGDQCAVEDRIPASDCDTCCKEL